MRSNIPILWLLAAATVFAQTPPVKPASVAGVVLNSVTNVPLPRVHVTLTREEKEAQTYGAMTASDGKFSITGIPPGPYSIAMERVGFSMSDDEHAPENNPLVLSPDSRKDDLKLNLLPAGAITGHVTNADGEPVQSAQVMADGMAGPAGLNSSIATTDARGVYRIGGLTPGKYRVRAVPENNHAPAELRTDGTFDVQDGPTGYGARVAVTPGGEASGVDIRLTRVPIVEVSGKVEGVSSGGFNTQLWIAEGAGGGRSSAGVKPDGSFRLWRLYPGKYEVSAMWQAAGGREFRTAPIAFEIAGSNIDHLVLRLIPPANISGHIEYQEDGAKAASGTAMRLALVGVGLQGGGTSAQVTADGSFEVQRLPAGRYRVIPSWKNSYVASMQLGPMAMDGSLLDLSSGATGTDLSVRLKAATGGISGRVSDNQGAAAGARVMLVVDGETGGIRPRSATSGPDGTYSFDAVAPGKYKLVVVQDADGENARLDAYESLMEPIEIHSQEKLSRDLKRRNPADQ